MPVRFNCSFRLFLLLLLLSPVQIFAEDGVLLVEKPHIMQPPPGAGVAAGFMVLFNPGDEDIVLKGASSDAFDHVEIHESVVENDVAKMIKQSELIIPAGDSVALEHGGFHLMLMGIKNPLEPDQEIPLMLDSSVGDLHIVLKVLGPGHRSKGGMHSGHDAKDVSKKKMKHEMDHAGDKHKDAN